MPDDGLQKYIQYLNNIAPQKSTLKESYSEYLDMSAIPSTPGESYNKLAMKITFQHQNLSNQLEEIQRQICEEKLDFLEPVAGEIIKMCQALRKSA